MHKILKRSNLCCSCVFIWYRRFTYPRGIQPNTGISNEDFPPSSHQIVEKRAEVDFFRQIIGSVLTCGKKIEFDDIYEWITGVIIHDVELLFCTL